MADNPTAQLAIQFALEKRWKEALATNAALIKLNSKDIDSHKRAAYAYLQLGDLKKSKSYYKKVLNLDSANPIALRALKKLEHAGTHTQLTAPSPQNFLEEPGKTKIATLVNLAPSNILYTISAGHEVALIPKKYSIEVRTGTKIYLGALPDDLSHRLLTFIAGGNVYEAFVHHVEAKVLSLFIREVTKGKKFAKIPSFIINNHAGYTAFVREDLIQKEALEIEGSDDHEE